MIFDRNTRIKVMHIFLSFDVLNIKSNATRKTMHFRSIQRWHILWNNKADDLLLCQYKGNTKQTTEGRFIRFPMVNTWISRLRILLVIQKQKKTMKKSAREKEILWKENFYIWVIIYCLKKVIKYISSILKFT